MKQTPKTIQIFLLGGDPQGIRIAEITTRIVQVIEVPRSLLAEFNQMPESGQVGLYFLFGENEEGNPSVYIGQTGDLRSRLVSRDRSKNFWERVLLVISSTNSLTQTHAVFLEWHCLKAARAAGRYLAENSNSGSKPCIPAPQEADCLEIFDTAKVLLATLGYPVFTSLGKSESRADEETYFCTSAGTDGRGLYLPEGFVLLKGSVGRKELVPSSLGTNIERGRAKLMEQGVFKAEGDKIIAQRDHLFSSPTMAAIMLVGRSSNGWLCWKNKDGTTLDELKRQNIEE
jgi:hypothetical protein